MPAEIGVVHLDPPRKRRLPLAPRHHRHDLVLHGPGRRLLDPETAAEFHRRDAVLRRHDQVDGGKPECLRQLGRVEDRARRGRCLLLAPVALIETPTPQHAMLPMAAAGADEAARPAQPDQRRAALLLRTEGLPKRLVAQTTHARCNLEPHNRDPLIQNILRTYIPTGGVSRISRNCFVATFDVDVLPLSKNDDISQRIGPVHRRDSLVDLIEWISGGDQFVELEFTVDVEINRKGWVGPV